MEDLTGLRLGQYQVVSPLGEGGMAAVYKAYQPGIERHVALKILPRHLASDPEFYGRFEQEAKLIAQLQHVHILPVHDFGEQDGYTYIVMPLIETGTLADLMAGDPLPFARIRSVIRQVGEALGYAHARGLVHRDIKPSNILVDEVGNCLLTDFGIAKIVAASVHFTRTGAIIGTPAYMSPEQIQGEGLDGRSDQYSLGIVLFEMATGRPPFKAETPPAILVKHLHDPLPMPRAHNPEIPEALERVIMKCLAKHPQDRYAQMSDMLDALARALPDQVISGKADLARAGAATTQVPAAGDPAAARQLEQATPQPAPIDAEPAAAAGGHAPDSMGPGTGAAEAVVEIPHPAGQQPSARRIPRWAFAFAGIVAVAAIGWIGLSMAGSGRPDSVPTSVFASPTSAVPALAQTRQAPDDVAPTAVPTAAPDLPEGPIACTDEIGCIVVAPQEPLHIAYMLTVSGPTAFLGRDSLGGIELAIDDRGGALLGHAIQLTGEDSLCTEQGGSRAAEAVASDPTIVGVIGTSCSSAMAGAMDLISSAGLSIISPSNTAPTLTLEEGTWRPGYFRTAHSDLFQGWVAAEFSYEVLGARTLAAIHDGSFYSQALQQTMAGRFRDLGGTVTFQGEVSPGQTNMRGVLGSAAAGEPDVLYFPVFEPAGDFIVQQSSDFDGLANTILMGADGLLVDSFPENAGPNAEGMYLSGPYVSGPAYDQFLAKWNAKYGEVPPSGFHAFAYDATNILLDAIERVALQDRAGTLYIGRHALREAISATSGYPGLTGELDCRSKQFPRGTTHGDCATGEALGIFQITSAEISGGKWPPEVVWTP